MQSYLCLRERVRRLQRWPWRQRRQRIVARHWIEPGRAWLPNSFVESETFLFETGMLPPQGIHLYTSPPTIYFAAFVTRF